MKRLYKATIFFVIISCNSGQKNKVVDIWENGKTRILITYENPNDTLTYLREFYFENGKLGSKGKYLKGKQEGLWEWWYDNGNKKDEATFSKGFYIGLRKHWREDGTLKEVEVISGQCAEHCCDGKVIYYSEKGEKLIEYTLKNGEKNGVGNVFYADGKIKRKFIYINGKKNGLTYEYYPNGQIEVEGNYLDDLENGKWTFKDSLGNIKGYTNYKEGQVLEAK